MKTNEQNTKTTEKHKKKQWKPMNKNNDKQRTAHEIYGEPKKIYEHIKEKPMRTTKTNEKPKKEQWKTMKNNGKPKTILPAF